MEYKRKYERDELDELQDWYRRRESQLPASFRVSEAINVPDMPELARTIQGILKQKDVGGKVAFSGMLHKFFKLREALIKAHPELA